jgi:hypothetical protein
LRNDAKEDPRGPGATGSRVRVKKFANPKAYIEPKPYQVFIGFRK